jgi:hypothetical protein
MLQERDKVLPKPAPAAVHVIFDYSQSCLLIDKGA